VKVDPENLTGIGQRKEIMGGIILIEENMVKGY
jgi:hypothetical protein